MALTVTTDERAELERRVRSLKIRAEEARRARLILMLADGESYSTIEATVPCYREGSTPSSLSMKEENATKNDRVNQPAH